MKAKSSRVAVPVLCVLFLYASCFEAEAAIGSSRGGMAATAAGDHSFLQAGAAVDASDQGDKRKPSKLGYSYQAYYSIYDFGGVCDGAHIAADTAALNAAANYVDIGGSVKIPSGLQCQYDNSTAPLTFTNPTGRFFGDGSGSKISFSTLSRDAIDVNTGSGFRIDGLNLSMSPSLTTRGGGYLVNISNGQNITASDLWLSNSDLSGMRWANVTTGHITRVHISNTLANGFFTINNRHLMVVNPSCNNTGDYCFETSYYDSQGTPCTDITVTGLSSENDIGGMLNNACKNVSFTNFVIDGAAKRGISIDQDSTTTTTQWPDNTVVGPGVMTKIGYGANSGGNSSSATGFYMNINTIPPSGVYQRITIANVQVVHVAGNGLFLGDNGTIDLQLGDSLFDLNGGNGAIGTNGRFQAAIDVDGHSVSLSHVRVTNAAGPALYLNTTVDFTADHFTSVNPNTSGNTGNSIYTASRGTVNMNGVYIYDSSATNRSEITDVATAGITNIRNIGGLSATPLPPPTSGKTSFTYSWANESPVNCHGANTALTFDSSTHTYGCNTNGGGGD